MAVIDQSINPGPSEGLYVFYLWKTREKCDQSIDAGPFGVMNVSWLCIFCSLLLLYGTQSFAVQF